MENIRFAIAIALAGALTLAGCTAAGSSSMAATSGTTKASAGKPASPPGLAHVTAYSINTDNPVLTSVVSGAISDYGPAEEVPPGSTGISAHGSELELKLTRGTFRLKSRALTRSSPRDQPRADLPLTGHEADVLRLIAVVAAPSCLGAAAQDSTCWRTFG